MARAIILGEDKVKENPIARIFSEDLVVDDELSAEGSARFFTSTKKGGEWGSFSKDRDILAITVLAPKDRDESPILEPVVGARAIVRLRLPNKEEGMVVLDACTRGDGTTIPLPSRVFPRQTPLGQLLHCPISKGDDFRVEIHAPGWEGTRVRVVLHTLRADEV
jgi:hypothetical protein